MAVRGVDDDQIDAGIDQPLGAGEAVVADGRRGGDAQAPLLVLAGVGVEHRLFDVLDGDEADAAIVVVDDEQLLDAVLVQEALGLLLSALSSRTVMSFSLVISSEIGCPDWWRSARRGWSGCRRACRGRRCAPARPRGCRRSDGRPSA